MARPDRPTRGKAAPARRPRAPRPRAADYLLARRLAFRATAGLAALVALDRGELLELNAAAGALLTRLEQGRGALDAAEQAFAAELVALGLASRRRARGGSPASRAPKRRSRVEGEPAAATHSSAAAQLDLLDQLNRRAERRCVPLHAQLELTYRCGLGCGYCYLDPRAQRGAAEATTGQWRGWLDQLAELGTLFVQLTGGEPFARPDLEAIVRHAQRRRFAVSLLTSGWHMDQPVARRLARGGLDSVQISLHGPDAASHEQMTRVPGSFAAAWRALLAWRDWGVRTQAAVTVTRANAARLPELLALLSTEGLGVSVSCYVQPRRNGKRDTQELLLSDAELRRVLRAAPPSAAPRLAGRTMADRPCGAGRNTLAIDPHGTVFPCQAWRLAVGSAATTPLRQIWARSHALRSVRSLRIGKLQGCPSCAWLRHCNRCTGSAVAEGLQPTDHSEFDCRQAQARAELAGGEHRRRVPLTGHGTADMIGNVGAVTGGQPPTGRPSPSTGGSRR